MTNTETAHTVLTFWFEESTQEQWFEKDNVFDATIRKRFEPTVKSSLRGERDRWADTISGCLALIIVLDQFTRNIYRGTPRAFSGDEVALALSLRCLNRGYLDAVEVNQRHFMLMPLMHSEDLAIQDMSLPLFETHTNERTLDFAQRHRDIIARFGRFPHRNAILGRPSSSEETEFLTQPGSSF